MIRLCWAALLLVSIQSVSSAYPIDGFLRSGIRRLVRVQLVEADSIRARKLPHGGLKPLADVQLWLDDEDRASDIDSLPPIDADLQAQLEKIFPRSYSVAVVDMTPGRPVRYAAQGEERGYQPGSVGKLAVLTAIFCELENLYPNDFGKRIELLKSTMVEAGPEALYDHHTVPIFDPETGKYERRTVRDSDVFSLYEWIDHMVSVSNNGAASVVWREALKMRVFQNDYPISQETYETYLDTTPRKEIMEYATSVVNEPLRHLGITNDEWRLGQLFTRGGSRRIPATGGSIGTPRGLAKWIVALEKGDIMDDSTSLEMKRLMLMTDRRIRYAKSNALDSAAVYFKSGSLYKCDRNKWPECGKYKGNVYNYMNSVAIVEQPDSTVYAVALMTNILKRNSAYDHYVLARKIDNIVRKEPVQEEEKSESEAMRDMDG